jgi:lipopolysaccharide/colanic/teichoic acid biosynthesis glycosyltransferase
MNDKKDAEGNLLSDELRLTKLEVLFETSLMKFHNCANVLKAIMSLIVQDHFYRIFTFVLGRAKKRHQVKPGITGWAQ